MTNTPKKKTTICPEAITRGLAVAALCAAALALAVFLLVPKTPALPEESAPGDSTTAATESLIPPNPYGPEDFGYEGEYLQCLAGPAKLGIDVSSHQGDIDWPQVAGAGVEFAIVRIGYRGTTSGGLYGDEYAVRNLQGAKAAGLQIGAYFYSQALTPAEAAKEAAYCITMLQGYDLDLPVVFDWEFAGEGTRSEQMDPDTLMACTQVFCQAVEDAGFQPMIYFNKYLASEMLTLEELVDYPFWLAMYTDQMDYPHAVQMWQYTPKGNIPGIAGDVDLNLWFTG